MVNIAIAIFRVAKVYRKVPTAVFDGRCKAKKT